MNRVDLEQIDALEYQSLHPMDHVSAYTQPLKPSELNSIVAELFHEC